MPRVALLALLVLAACAEFPEVDAAVASLGEGPPPILLPTDDLLARASVPPLTSDAAQAGLQGRVARLKARAAALRARPVE